MADTKGGMESSVPMIMGGRKASAFHVRNQEEEKNLWKKPDGDFAKMPHFFNSIISLLNFYDTLAVLRTKK